MSPIKPKRIFTIIVLLFSCACQSILIGETQTETDGQTGSADSTDSDADSNTKNNSTDSSADTVSDSGEDTAPVIVFRNLLIIKRFTQL
ncbi:MAG: hypothetical protein JXX29_22755, partial [Deltaproteobacteria bacterium]|nr:hypothetical protein [Deltaproteobacteria bacterium]